MIYVKTIWPEVRQVPSTEVMGWAEDAFINGEIDDKPGSLEHAVELLVDAGHITVPENPFIGEVDI